MLWPILGSASRLGRIPVKLREVAQRKRGKSGWTIHIRFISIALLE